MNILPQCGFKNKYIKIACFLSSGDCRNTQFTCSDYEKLGEYLWNNHTSIISEFTDEGRLIESFKCCSADVRSHIPASWGGTGSDDELIFTKKMQKRIDNLLEQI